MPIFRFKSNNLVRKLEVSETLSWRSCLSSSSLGSGRFSILDELSLLKLGLLLLQGYKAMHRMRCDCERVILSLILNFKILKVLKRIIVKSIDFLEVFAWDRFS